MFYQVSPVLHVSPSLVLLNTSCEGLVQGVCGSVAIKHQHSNSYRLEILNLESAEIQHYQTLSFRFAMALVNQHYMSCRLITSNVIDFVV